MSNTAVVKVYGSATNPELLALVPIHREDVAEDDDVLIHFAEIQIRRRFPAAKLEVSRFRIERGHEPKPPYPRHLADFAGASDQDVERGKASPA